MVKSLKAKIFLVEMNWKYVINVCQGVIDKRSINGSFNNSGLKEINHEWILISHSRMCMILSVE